MRLYKEILQKKEKIAVVGLGYVGMPIAVEFSKHVDVIGFDINKAKVEAYKRGEDPTQEVGDNGIKTSKVEW
ncbi:MAG: nucleotide sugar dehydrogenase, partial [Candidatus Onthovivens sp.]|nr:nucleotide sugar dehydrogenase [Candidatus Onthovivens sp.]